MNNQLIIGNAIEELCDIESSTIDTCVTDEPYGVHINSDWDKNMPSASLWNEVYRILKPGSYCVMFGQPSMIVEKVLVMSKTNFVFRDMWAWTYQGTHTKGFKTTWRKKLYRSRIRNVYNPIFVYRKCLEGTEEENWEKYKTNLFNTDDNRIPYKGNHDSILKKFKKTGQKHLQSIVKSSTFGNMDRKGWIPNCKGAEPTNVFYIPRAKRSERTANGRIENDHETVKPLTLMLKLVGLVTNNNSQIVIDPFMGTGSTGCACKILDRNFIGIDNKEETVEIARIRINYAKDIVPIA